MKYNLLLFKGSFLEKSNDNEILRYSLYNSSIFGLLVRNGHEWPLQTTKGDVNAFAFEPTSVAEITIIFFFSWDC